MWFEVLWHHLWSGLATAQFQLIEKVCCFHKRLSNHQTRFLEANISLRMTMLHRVYNGDQLFQLFRQSNCLKAGQIRSQMAE